jgi:hypothetical protein
MSVIKKKPKKVQKSLLVKVSKKFDKSWDYSPSGFNIYLMRSISLNKKKE